LYYSLDATEAGKLKLRVDTTGFTERTFTCKVNVNGVIEANASTTVFVVGK